jgi:alkylation response protein AidB-like acyl-CoA dehydrogenase
VTPAGIVSPTEVSADGTLRTPRVVGARDAGLLLLAVRDADSGWQLHAVPATSCTAYATPALSASRDLSTVHWPLASDTLLAYGVAAEAAAGLLADRAAAGTAALLVGLAERMLSLSAAYAKERHQFGKPIGSFQAVKHICADMLVRSEVARAAVHAAACLADAPDVVAEEAERTARSPDDVVTQAVLGAKILADEAAVTNARAAIQVHGGMGFTWEVPLHLHLKRSRVLATTFGSPSRLSAAVSALI